MFTAYSSAAVAAVEVYEAVGRWLTLSARVEKVVIVLKQLRRLERKTGLIDTHCRVSYFNGSS